MGSSHSSRVRWKSTARRRASNACHYRKLDPNVLMMYSSEERGDAEPYQPPTLMAQDHHSIEQLLKNAVGTTNRIDRSNACCMVVPEGLPAL